MSDPLQDALLQLAQTMGLSQSSSSVSINDTSTPLCSLDAKTEKEPNAEAEDGELEANDIPPSTTFHKKMKPTVQAPKFTGDIDAETMLRGSAKRKQKQLYPKPDKFTKLNISAPPKLPCKYFREGKCGKGEACTYSHAFIPNKTADQAKTTEVCRFHINGTCLKGNQCLFSHDLSKVPCKFFHVKGSCSMGGECRFSHEPLEESQRNQLFAEVLESRDPRLRQMGITSPPPPSTSTVVPRRSRLFTLDPPWCNMKLHPKVEQLSPFLSPFRRNIM